MAKQGMLYWRAADGVEELVELDAQTEDQVDDKANEWAGPGTAFVSPLAYVEARRVTELTNTEVLGQDAVDGDDQGRRSKHVEQEWDVNGKSVRRMYLRTGRSDRKKPKKPDTPREPK